MCKANNVVGVQKDDEWNLDPCRMWLVHICCWRREKMEQWDLISWVFGIELARTMKMMILISRRKTKDSRCRCCDEDVLLPLVHIFFQIGSFGKYSGVKKE